ncbi:MATE family efflux transporter [Hominenteromicrobium sp.]|uniref:MATE family efflux transporter n=1 Tax=Hominenteromicrobium sp. TaxID=3073581 RepID=UPI00399A507E
MFSDKDLRKLIVPLVIEQILAVLVGTADTVMVSYAGESAISGVSLVDMFAYMVITILTALATGGAVIVSQYLGNKEQENANRAAGQLMVGTLLASGVVCVICAALNSQILHLLYGSAEESVLQAAETYMFITAFSFPFLGIYNSSAALFRSMKKDEHDHVRFAPHERHQHCRQRNRYFRAESGRCRRCGADAFCPARWRASS